MKLFELRVDLSKCCTFRPSTNGLYAWSNVGAGTYFDGVARGGNYPAVDGKRNLKERKNGPLPDFTEFALSPIPTFSDRAIDILGEFLSEHGEFTPTIQMDEPMEYKAFNCTTIFDCLDEDRSELKRFSDGPIMSVTKYVLQSSVEKLPPIFKMPQLRMGNVYVNQDFVKRTEGLLGFRFIELFER